MSGNGIPAIVDRLEADGWCLCDDFLPPADAALLRQECLRLWRKDRFRRAGIGIGDSWQLREDIRGDHVLWLEEGRRSPAQERYVQRMEQLRLALNARYYLGLFEFEAHFAVYPPGKAYHQHLDQFRGTTHRKVSAILYLNETWQPGDGGALRLYTGADGESGAVEVLPLGGRLVVFWSGRFYHEVLPAERTRCSLAGWLRTR